MNVGSFGKLVFSVSPNKIETLTNLQRKGSANYSVHNRHGSSALLEFTGRPPEEISFEMTLSYNLGVNVLQQIDLIKSYTQKGAVHRLIIGKRVYGSYKWVISSYSVSYKYFGRQGKVVTAVVSVNMKEYCK